MDNSIDSTDNTEKFSTMAVTGVKDTFWVKGDDNKYYNLFYLTELWVQRDFDEYNYQWAVVGEKEGGLIKYLKHFQRPEKAHAWLADVMKEYKNGN